VKSSPFFRARVAGMNDALKAAREAIRFRRPEEVMRIAEADTLNLHAVTMTMADGLITWRGETVEAMHRVRRLREEGVPAYFSIDTGATVYVNTLQAHRRAVREALEDVVPTQRLLDLSVGREAHLVDRHLF
jgi:phosphomevalonate decarboxylase